jgi:serine/threonine protein kinase
MTEPRMQQDSHRTGDVIASKYVVERLLGRGGMGAVYVVQHQLTGKKLALKCLLPEHAADTELTARFLREAQAAGRIQHRHVVDVFDVGQDDDLLYMVMPLLEGKPLSDLLKEGALNIEDVLGIVIRAMEGVSAAHSHGIVHRDLKPDNIFVCVGPSGRYDDPRVLDFGISKRDDDMSQPLTRSGVMMGTPHYMSFEQINSQRDLDQRVDVYAIGVILYEALSGSPPHMAESVGQLAIRMMSTAPARLDELRPDLPPGLSDVVMTAISRDREDRYPTMQAFLEALRPFHPARPSSFAPEGVAPRTSLPPSVRSNDLATVKVSVPETRDPARHMQTTPAGMLRAMREEQSPPRVIAPGGKLGSVLLGLVLLFGAAGATGWFLTSKNKHKPTPVATPEPAPARAPTPAAPAPAEPAPALAAGGSEPDQLGKPDAPAPVKKKKKRRRRHASRAGAAAAVAATPHKSVVLFVDSDGGVWEEEETEEEETEPVSGSPAEGALPGTTGGEATPPPAPANGDSQPDPK